MIFDGLSFLIDMLVELCSLLVIDGLELLEEGFLEGGVGDGLVVVDQVGLIVLLEGVEDISLHQI